MHELVTMVSGWLVNYLAHSAMTLTVMGAVAWLGGRMLRKAGPQAQHRMWVAVLLAGVAVPLLPPSVLRGLFSHAAGGAAGGTATVTYHMIAASAGRWALAPLLTQVLAGAYLLTVLFFMARLVWRWRRTAAMARRSAVLPLHAAGRVLVESAARRLGVTAPPIRCSTETHGPVMLGLRRTMLLVPEGFFAAESGGDFQIEGDVAAALAHECAHIARRDFAKNLLYEFVAAAVAYHPASWMMRRRIAETRELVCDEMAVGTAGDRPEYAASLLRLATAMAGLAAQPIYANGTQAIGVFDAGILEERVMRLTMDMPKVSRTRKIAMAVVTTIALLGGAATAAALSFDVAQDGAATAGRAHEKVYKVGGDVSAPKLIYSVDAEFSKEAKDAKYQGVSVVALVVDAHGMPQHVHTVRKLKMGLDEKAIEAVRQYKFDPAMRKGKPVAVAINIEVNFRLY